MVYLEWCHFEIVSNRRGMETATAKTYTAEQRIREVSIRRRPTTTILPVLLLLSSLTLVYIMYTCECV